MITIHGYSPSGNCHKLRMLLGHLGREHRWVETDSAHGATRTAEYLAKNPNGKVPMLETEDGRILVESNAILVWLAEGTRYFAGDAWQRAQTLSWMFFEQYSHEPYIAVRRALVLFAERAHLATPERLATTLERGNKALTVMERQLERTDFLAGGELSIADICLYAYTHVANEAGFDLSAFPAVSAWLDRVGSHPGHVTMDWLPK